MRGENKCAHAGAKCATLEGGENCIFLTEEKVIIYQVVKFIRPKTTIDEIVVAEFSNLKDAQKEMKNLRKSGEAFYINFGELK